MVQKLGDTSMGQFTQDESIAPLIEGLWDEAKIAYEDVKADVGLDLEDYRIFLRAK